MIIGKKQKQPQVQYKKKEIGWIKVKEWMKKKKKVNTFTEEKKKKTV